MPFYRIDGLVVHIRGSKLPPPCRAVVGIGDKRHFCAGISGFYCDWPTGGGRTCDAALCDAHARQVGPNRHYCPDHHAEHTNNQAQRGLFTGLVES